MYAAAPVTPARFAAVVGEPHVRTAAEADVVHGVRPSLVVEPADEGEVAAVLAEASRQGLAVVVRGGGTMLEWGAPPRRCHVVLSTQRLDRVVEHQPGDLICVAQAGVTMAALQAALDLAPGRRQRLMIDPPRPPESASLGGIVATGVAGPLRTRYGTIRDLLIGVRFALADGTVGHAGGKVVKNVAGYDVGKLLIASLGTLAVVTEVALRLHPEPAAARTVVIEESSAARLAVLVETLRRLPVTPSSVDILWPAGLCVIRLESSAAGAERQARLITGRLGGSDVGAEEGRRLGLLLHERPWAGDGAVAGVAAPRDRLAALLDACKDWVEEVVLRAPLVTGEARLAAEPGAVVGLRAAVQGVGGHTVLHRAPPSLGPLVWPERDGVEMELMASVKRALDPGGILAPGRYLGGI
jgi:glycolate oxidase FAD binding subunit